MSYSITTTRNPVWLISGDHRVRIDTIERYEKRGAKLILYGPNWTHALDYSADETPEATTTAVLAILDAFFAPPQS
jgi:hypothetical protein